MFEESLAYAFYKFGKIRIEEEIPISSSTSTSHLRLVCTQKYQICFISVDGFLSCRKDRTEQREKVITDTKKINNKSVRKEDY